MAMGKILQVLLDPYPIRSTTKYLIRKFALGSYEQRVRIGAVDRPSYGYCMYQAALLARKLGYSRISAIEFGVAGGNGLINLEHHAQYIQDVLSISIDIYGFDSGKGLPEPSDYRDLPYNWRSGFFKMDHAKLQDRLKSTQLILGDVKDTVKKFFEMYTPEPIGAVLFDLDLYSSTISALKIFDADERFHLPRIFCYFDNINGGEIALHNNYVGERLAICEFNKNHRTKKLSASYYLLSQKVVEPWHHKIWIYHNFEHKKYNDFIGREVPLSLQ